MLRDGLTETLKQVSVQENVVIRTLAGLKVLRWLRSPSKRSSRSGWRSLATRGNESGDITDLAQSRSARLLGSQVSRTSGELHGALRKDELTSGLQRTISCPLQFEEAFRFRLPIWPDKYRQTVKEILGLLIIENPGVGPVPGLVGDL